MKTITDKLRVEGLSNEDILELEEQTEVLRLPREQNSATGAHHDMSAVPIIIAAAGPFLTLLGCLLVKDRLSRRNRIKVTRITKEGTFVIEIDLQESVSKGPKAELIEAVAKALTISPSEIVEALGDE